MGQADVPLIAHELAVAPIRARAAADQPEPTLTFSGRLTLAPGGRAIELHYLGPSHTDNLIVAFVPDAGVVFGVDFVSNDRVGYQALAGFHFPGQIDAIGALLDLPFTTVVFGHGPPGNRATIQRQLTYYDDLRAAVRSAIREGLTEEQAAARVRLDAYAAWEQYEAWFPLNVRGVYRAYSGGS
jgi:cyclase